VVQCLTGGQRVRVRAVSAHCLGIEVRVNVKVKGKAKALSMFSIRHHVMCDEWRFSSTNS
jgi:hypothetical protein